MLKRISHLIFLIRAALVFFLCTSCTQSTLPEKTDKGDTLIIPEYQTLARIHPLLTRSTLSTRLSQIVFDGLIRLNEKLEPQPHIARFWERSKDGRIWTFHIRPGIQFHDGIELTADDIAFTYQMVKNPEIGRNFLYVFKEVEKIVVKDKYTFQVFLKRPIASFLLTLYEIGILPKHLLEGQDFFTSSFNDSPIGTGPFRLEFWSDKEVRLDANPSYFLGRPYLNKILVKVYPSREAAWAKLTSGEADFFYWLTPENYDFLKQVPSLRIYSIPRPYYYMINFNLKNEIFTDQSVRQALNYAVNKEEIVSKALNGEGQAAAGPILPGSWAYNPDVKPYPYDPKKALALLEKAGWKDRDGDNFLDRNGKIFEFTVYVNVGDNLKEKALLIVQQYLLDIGIKMHLKFFDASDITFLVKKDFQAIFPEIQAFGDPDIGYMFWHSSQIKNGLNHFSYHNPDVDRLLDMGRAEFDAEKRRENYFRYQEEIHQDPPGIFLFWTTLLVGFHERFQGVQINYAEPLFLNIQEVYVPKAKQRYVEKMDSN